MAPQHPNPHNPNPQSTSLRSATQAAVDPTRILIVGAGPAGCAAAITLARAGFDVTVLDKAGFPRDKICGDGLTAAALRHLESLGLDPHTIASWTPVHEVHVHAPSGHRIDLPLPSDGLFAAVAPRLELDNALVGLARDAGARVLEGVEVVGAHQTGEAATLALKDGSTLSAPFVICADGMWSTTRRSLGLTPDRYLGDWHAFRQYFSGVTGPAATELHVLFEPDLLPGYFWSFPLGGGRANVGFGIVRPGTGGPQGKVKRVRDMKDLWPDLLARPHISALLGPDAVGEDTHRAWPIPARVAHMTAAAGRFLFVGDAVAACDPMTGEGIGQALLTGILAADAIRSAPSAASSSPTPSTSERRSSVAADFGTADQPRVRWDGDHPHLVAAAYTKALRQNLVADHRMSLLLLRALRHRKGARAAVRVAGLTPWTRRNFGRWLFEDYPRSVVVTPRRWHRGMFTGPGSFTSRGAADQTPSTAP